VFKGGLTVSGTATFGAGHYIMESGVSISGTAYFGAGQYIMAGDFTVHGVLTTDSVEGVTIFLTQDPVSGEYGNIDIQASGNINITAAKSGAYLGIAFFQDRKAPTISTGSPNTFNGGSLLTITGAIYFPKQLLQFNGGSDSNAMCTRIVAHMISFTGTSGLGLGCGYNFGETAIYPPVVVE
jgi:hypothetical protein